MASSRYITLLPAASRAASADSASWDIDGIRSGAFYLVVTACSGGSDTLDVKIQVSPDNTNWFDVITFTQATGATTERKVLENLGRYLRVSATNGAGATAAYAVYADLHPV